MERGVDGGERIPRIVQVMYFNQLQRQAVPQNSNQQPDSAMPQQWDTQWQDFLKTLQPAHVGMGNPQVMESVPWEDAKAFLSSFEEVAETCQWPKDEWVGRLLPALRGGVKQCLWRLNARDRRDYGKVKSAILRDDAIRTEARRQHFRQCGYQEGLQNVYKQLQELCHQWLKPDKRSKEQILELIIQEQLLTMLPPEVQRMVKECGPGDCPETVALAENFLMSWQTALTRERPVPLPEGTARSRETEGILPNVAFSQLSASVNQTGNGEVSLMANEMTSARNSGVLLPPVSQEPLDVALDWAGCPAEVVDQKPSPWELMRHSFENANAPDGLLIPTPDSISHPEQPETQRTGETLPDSRSGGKTLSEIKAENSEETDVDDDMPVLSPEEFQDNVSESLEPSTKGELHPRKHREEQQPGRATRQRSKREAANRDLPKEKRYECPECSHKTYYLSELLRHMNCHAGKRPYKCLECGRSFLKEESFQSHQRIHNSTAGASSCKKVDRNSSSHQGSKLRHCTLCRFKTISVKQLTEHMKVHLGEKHYTCSECGQSFRWMSNLTRHKKLHTFRKSTGVHRLIHRSTDGLGKLKNHSLKHYKIRLEDAFGTSSDAVADGREPSVSSRLRPRKLLGEGTPYNSETQPEEPESEDLFGALQGRPMLRIHSSSLQEKSRGTSHQLGRAAMAVKRSINYGKKKKHACQQCEYKGERLSDLVKHMRVHSRERPYSCAECGITFRWLSNYNYHMKICTSSQRTPEAPVAECDVTLSDEEELINIVQKKSQPRGTGSRLVGTASKLPSAGQKGPGRQRKPVATLSKKYQNKEKNQECAVCGHRTFYLSDLLRHLEIHTREKPYKCLQCGKTFAQKSTLASHKKSCNTDSTPSSIKKNKKSTRGRRGRVYSCSTCGHKAPNLTTLLKHMRIHVRKRSRKCKECGETSESNLCRHQLDGAANDTKTSVSGHQETGAGSKEQSKMSEESSQQERTELKKTDSALSEAERMDVSLTVGGTSNKDQETTPLKEKAESVKGTESNTVGREALKLLNLEQFAYFKGEKSSQNQSEPVTNQVIPVKEEPCEIPVCEKSDSITRSLMKFQNDEEEEKPHICSDCGKCFSLAQLNSHQLMHRVKPYCCSVCGNTCSSSDALRTHLKTHDVSTTPDAPSIERAPVGALDDTSVTSDRGESSSDRTESQ